MTYLTGLVGQGIGQSRSADLHEAEAAAQGLTLVYRIIETEPREHALRRRLKAAQDFGFNGLNITHPFKQDVLELLDGVSDDARAIGAVNTVVFGSNGAIGYNTDWSGFGESMRRELPDAEMDRVTQIGAGGAGAATAYALLKMGAQRLTLYDAVANRALALTARMSRIFPDRDLRAAETLDTALEDARGVVQATPLGMASHPGMPFDPSRLSPSVWVIDVIYFPLETAVFKAARAIGCRVLNGLGMVAFQGAEAFELFTGHPADGQRILERLRRNVS